MEFKPFAKIPRLKRDIIVTEKIDGTNACVVIGENGEFATQSRNKIITPDDDNHGFSKWAHTHKEELMQLGKGYHYGEWWGADIGARRYGINEKRFSLFNVSRWAESRPSCCHIVPVLYQGVMCTNAIDAALEDLRANGSRAAAGFMKPEGVVIFHTASSEGFKVTLEKDSEPKSKQEQV